MPFFLSQTLVLAQIPNWVISLLAIGFLIVCLSLVLIVLIQRPQGGGLSGAFGAGGGAGQTAFGTKTGDVLTLVTIGIFVLFLLTAIGLNFAVRPPKAVAPANAVVSTEGTEEAGDTPAALEDQLPADEQAALETDAAGDEGIGGEPPTAEPDAPLTSPTTDPGDGAP